MGARWQIAIRVQQGRFELDVDIAGDERPTALVGPNGSGKTTLLRLLAGARRPDAGRIVVGGRTLFDAPRKVDVPPEARGIGYVPQGFGLFPHLTALENVAFGLRVRRERQGQPPRVLAARMLADLGCLEVADQLPATLSGGQRQRVALARALLVEPQLLLLDEPLAGIDISARRRLRRLLAERLAAHPGAAIVVSHDARDIVALGALVHVLEAGRVIQSGDAGELRRNPANEFVAELFAELAPA
jgi:molybdate transport system ATP-binding protein